MDLHCYISRETALTHRHSRYGALVVTVSDEWLSARTDVAIALLQSYGGTAETAIGGPSVRHQAITDARDIIQGTCSATDATKAGAMALIEEYERNGAPDLRLHEPSESGVAAWLDRVLDERQRVFDAQPIAKRAETECARGRAIKWERDRHTSWVSSAESYLACTPEANTRVSVYGSDGRTYVAAGAPARPHSDTVPWEEYLHASEREAAARLEDRLSAHYLQAVAAAAGKTDASATEAAEARAEKARVLEERAAWIAEHGSAHLRQLAELGYPLAASYRAERVAHELGGCYDDYATICGKLASIRDPSARAIDALLTERERLKGRHSVELQWLKDGGHLDDCEHEADDYGEDGEAFEAGPVLVVELMGETYVRKL